MTVQQIFNLPADCVRSNRLSNKTWRALIFGAANMSNESGLPARLHNLDALRGAAAVFVIIYHLATVRLSITFVPHGYLAVDLFFILSGIVIAHAYSQRLESGMGFFDFTRARIIRLYPLAVVGAALGLAVLLLKYVVSPGKVETLPTILVSSGLNALLLPSFFTTDITKFVAFPGNGPLWSLSFEVIINLVWASCLVKARTFTLCAITVVSGALYAAAVMKFGNANLGWDAQTYLAGFPRVTFGFLTGVLIHRFRTSHENKAGLTGGMLCALLALILLMPYSLVWDLISIFILLPLLAYLGSGPSQVKTGLGTLLGDLSYPLYVLHFPILLIASGVRQTMNQSGHSTVLVVLSLVVTVVLSWLMLKQFDEPVRNAWSKRWQKQAPQAKPTPVIHEEETAEPLRS